MRPRAGRMLRSASITSADARPRTPDSSNSPKSNHSPPNLKRDQPNQMVSARSRLSPRTVVNARASCNCHFFLSARLRSSSRSKHRRATASSGSPTPYRSITGTPAFFTYMSIHSTISASACITDSRPR